ncbi:MAG TPA: hypothetical protein VN939_23075 [Chthoniobacterales bacterium]|nr:hypothetical protein [Chthoniobacterales bacterium]
MKTIAAILLLGSTLPFRMALGGSAVFSQDESTVYLIDNQKELLQLDLGSSKLSRPALPKEIHQGQVTGLGRSNAGNILVLQGYDLIAYDPTANQAVPVFSFKEKLATDGTPEKWSPDDFAYNPTDGSILFSSTAGENTSLWFLPKDEKHARPVFVRRVDSVDGLSFSQTGQLFFGYRGDLWCGSIASDPEGAGGKPPEHIYYFNAIRIAPLATLETDEATPSAQGVQVTAAGPERIYLHSLRLGGSGFGTILSVAAPDSKVGMVSSDQNAADHSYFELDKRLDLYKAEIASAQFYGENGSESLLCISASGKKVFYRGSPKGSEESGLYLIENDQPPRKVADDLK